MSLLHITVILTSVLCVASYNIYDVTPDGNTSTCYQCLNVKHYLSNATKYLVSNTQLHFLPGLHDLPTDLIIQNVHNISLIGSATNGTTPDTVIRCTTSVGIIMDNITNLTIQNMVIKNCKTKHDSLHVQVALFMKQCHFLRLNSVHIYHDKNTISILGFNILGNSCFNAITCQEIHFYYNEIAVKAKSHNILVNSFLVTNHFKSEYGIYLNMSQSSYEIILQIVNTTVQQLKRSAFLFAISNSLANINTLLIYNLKFHNNSDKTIWYLFYLENISVVNFLDCQMHYNRISKLALVKILYSDSVTFCNFNLEYNKHHRNFNASPRSPLIKVTCVSNVSIKHCFIHNNKITVLDASDSALAVKNTTFLLNEIPVLSNQNSILQLKNSRFLLTGLIIFRKNKNNFASVISLHNSTITVYGYLKFSENFASSIIRFLCHGMPHCYIMKVLDNTTISIVNNVIFAYFIDETNFYPNPNEYIHPPCFFQYFSTKNLDNNISVGNFSIKIKHNTFANLSLYHMLEDLIMMLRNKPFIFLSERFGTNLNRIYHYLTITHCYWLPQSAFSTAIPLDVNKQYIKQLNNSKLLRLIKKKILCLCRDEKQYDCLSDELNSLYPGQALMVSFYVNANHASSTEIAIELNTKQTYSVCSVLNAEQNIQFIDKKCTSVKYAIAFPNNSWCELILKRALSQTIYKYDSYYIRELPCPLGFVKLDGICQCYPSFKQFGFVRCNIKIQAILRPSRGWLQCSSYMNAHNDSYHSCDISQLCPYDYCKPYSFFLDFSAPDSQCQFKRSGILCGQCQQGLSTVFGSHHCQHCSNIYLLLIIPIAIAGVALVLLLFILNLTVTDGTINSFILYVNVISINSEILLPEHHTISPVHIFISLTNLNLGIQTCFYNGMDDYAKIWLQLAFPFYIMSIATLIVVVSRYSITVKRFTALRASSVLATLFLLCFTSILRTTSNVLFSYSSITHLPSKHTRLVWSTDPNIPLFGTKFTLLFILCVILFSLLLLFTITLLCAKALLKYKLLSPILHIYQRPYWLFLQLLMRMIFLYISHLDKTVNITINITVLCIINAVHGIKEPYQNRLQDYQETCILMNLFGLYVFTLSKWWIANEVLTFIVGFQFILIIAYRIVNQFCAKKCYIREHSIT